MPQKVRIALDGMGGDVGAPVVILGAEMSLERHPDSEFLVFGDAAAIEPLVHARPRLNEAVRVMHTDVAIKMDEKPSQALRHGRWKSSMALAIDAVKRQEADVAVSAGNTGALMAMAKFKLKTMAGIERPALAALWPTLRGESVVLDVGASIGADPRHLVNLAIMGAAMARVVFGLERPRVGLLNVGVETVKGPDDIREADRMLREAKLPELDYTGFVEGTDIGEGSADVVVTEGFAGNIALKTAEGTARQIGHYMRSALNRTWRSRLGAILAWQALSTLREKMDPGKANGGVFLGLNGIVIKSHGGSDATGFAAAIDLGYDMVRHELRAKIEQTLGQVDGVTA
jgi:glycerol-3-phosphate acyltransferase PlsX